MRSRYMRPFIVGTLLLVGVWLCFVAGSSVSVRAAPVEKPQAPQQLAAAGHQAIAPYTLPEVHVVYFPETGHHLSNRAGFLDFWRANGRQYLFGLPISEEIIEDGRLVQYFEHVRFEHHPEKAGTEWEVQIGLIGKERYGNWQQTAVADPGDGTLYFAETGHTLRGEFRQYWERRGGVRIFGLPISEEIVENGQTVQYFERVRLEHNPGDMDPFYRAHEYYGRNLNTLYEVKVGDMGQELAASRHIDTRPVKQLKGAPEWSPALWTRQIEVNLTTQWLTAYEDDLVVYRAPVTTGRPGFYTPAGEFAVYDKLPIQTMVGSVPGESWNVPNIPWVMYVHGGVAMHGTYWHTLFGSGALMSHGCINLSMDDAQWLYEWNDIGTKVWIHY